MALGTWAGGHGPYHASGLLRGSLVKDEPVPIYSPDLQDEWNRVHHLLFTTRLPACVSRYYEDAAVVPPAPKFAAAASERERFQLIYQSLLACTRVDRLEGGDLPEFVFGYEVGFLVKDPRFGQATAVLRKLGAAEPRGRTLEARILFQHDLWNRFDLVFRLAGSTQDAETKRRAEQLLGLLGRAIARLAPSRAELGSLRPNFPEIAQVHPQAAPDLFSGASPWRELIPYTDPGEHVAAHSRSVGYRSVFRSFVKVPAAAGGPACLEKRFQRWPAPADPCPRWEKDLAPGSRALLLESLLALASDGAVVAVPLVIGMQTRDVGSLPVRPDGRLQLGDLPGRVYHGVRADLAATPRRAGGLRPLEVDAPVPSQFAAFGRPPNSTLAPVAVVCGTCHDADGSHLMTPAFHNVVSVAILAPQKAVAQGRVIRAKQSSRDYQALREFFAGTDSAGWNSSSPR